MYVMGACRKALRDVTDAWSILAKPVEVVHDKAGAQVGGNAVKATAVHYSDSLLLSSSVVLLQNVPHPDDFSWTAMQHILDQIAFVRYREVLEGH